MEYEQSGVVMVKGSWLYQNNINNEWMKINEKKDETKAEGAIMVIKRNHCFKGWCELKKKITVGY